MEPIATVVLGQTEAPPRRFAVVFNPAAGTLLGRGDVEAALTAAFAEHGLIAELIPPEAGTLAERFTRARDSGADAVVAVGGDGSVGCAATLLVDSAMPLAILPSGTMNLLAKDLAIPVGDLAQAVKALVTAVPRAIDVGEVNGHVFLCGSMLGLPTRIGHHREAGRGAAVWNAWPKLLRGVLRVLARQRAMRLTLVMDGQPRRVRVPALNVTVNALSDAAGHHFGRLTLDGGQLAVYLITHMRLWDVLRIGLRVLFGHWREDPAVEEVLAGELVLRGSRPAMRVMNDGEAMLLDMPLHYRIRPGALIVLAPA